MSNYYIQRHASGLADGNLIFWKYNDCGYTTFLKEAKHFSYKEMYELIKHDKGEKYTAWPVEYLDSKAEMSIEWHGSITEWQCITFEELQRCAEMRVSWHLLDPMYGLKTV